jgi:site-specific DNA recombinase
MAKRTRDMAKRTRDLPKLHLGYVRVSTEDQATNGCSLAAQEAKVRAHAFASDRELAEVIVDDGYSAKNLDRPGMQRLIELIRAGRVASVTAVKLDRFTRSVRDLADLLDLAKKHDLALVSVGESLDTSSASGRMVVNILGVLAQWERETTAERTSVAMQHMKAQGLFTGGKRPRYGYRLADGALVPDPREQEGLDLIRSMRAEGASLRKIAAALTKAGFAPPSGSRWHATSVESVLQSSS